MWATDTGRKLVDAAFRWALIVGAVVAALAVWALWNVIVFVAPYVLIVAVALWDASLYIALFEGLVVVSAFLDVRDARLRTRSWKHAWLVAHRTVAVRAFRRARWVGALVKAGCEQLVKTPHLDVYAPAYRGAVVLELERAPQRTDKAA